MTTLDKKCFKVDRPNAWAMTLGFSKNNQQHFQSMWLSVTRNKFPMLMTYNRSKTPFKLSNIGGRMDLENINLDFKYIATLSNEYFVKNDIKLWEETCSNGLFDIWNPMAPYTRFDVCKSPPRKFRVQLLRIYEIKDRIKSAYINNASTHVDHIIGENTRRVQIKKPVMTDDQFRQYRQLLEKTVSNYLY